MFAFVMMANILFSQNVTVNVTLLNNSQYKSVDLQLAYKEGDAAPAKLATAEIKNDRFVIRTTLQQPDIYALSFADNALFLLCLRPNDNINMTLDATDLRKVVSVTGSESVAFTQKLSDMFIHQKSLLDSLNEALQNDATQLYFSNFIAKFKPVHLSARATDSDISSSIEKNDSLMSLLNRCAPDGKLDKKQVDAFLTGSLQHMKTFKNYYAAYKGYRDAAKPLTVADFTPVRGFEEIYANLQQYILVTDDYQLAVSSTFDLYYEKMEKLVSDYEEFYFDGKLESTKAKMNFCNQILAVVKEYGSQVLAKKDELNASVKILSTLGNNILTEGQKHIQDVVARYQSVYNENNKSVTDKSRALILENKTDLATLMFIDQFAQDKALQTEVITALHEKFPSHPLVNERYDKINTPQNRTATGNVAPELEFPDPSGVTRKLSSLKGKVVLIDFWASWCGPCRKENPNVVKMYAKYHDKGFEVFSVSLDNKKENWEAAIQKDGLVWPNHVSDLKGWGSAAAKLYGVSSIPCTFLLDREGRILARGLRGPELERALQQLFGE